MLKRCSAVVSFVSVVAVLAVPHGLAFAQECAPAAVASCPKTGPQSPRDIEKAAGTNPVRFSKAPPAAGMKLCNVHFHRFAEHKLKDTQQAALESGEGYICTAGKAFAASHEADHREGCEGVGVGDTIEMHWVYTTCNVDGAPCLTSCFSDGCKNPELRVEAQVFYLTPGSFPSAEDWAKQGYTNAPPKVPDAVEYLGSTTGPAYNRNDACSPFQATWNVRRECRPLSLDSLNAWCKDNKYQEHHGHGVRTLVTNPGLLSAIP
jgi:hypothetical protein